MSATTTTQSPADTEPDDFEGEQGNTGIDRMSALDGLDNAGLILTDKGRARCLAALGGMSAITDVLFQLDTDQCSTGGVSASRITTNGLLQALAVCTEFLSDHIGGEGGSTSLAAQAIDRESAAFAVVVAVHERLRMGGAAPA